MGFLRKKWLVCLLLFLVSSGVYIPSLRNDFVWDDVETIENSYYMFNASRLSFMFIPPEMEEKESLYYRPMIYASMVVDEAVWGVSALGFHLSNIVFNALSVIFFYLMALLLLGELKYESMNVAAFVAALLFAFFPMHAESVSWVSGRSDVLCALFFFLALIFHIHSWRKPVFLLLTAVTFTLSLLSKEVALVFPLMALTCDLISRNKLRRSSIVRYSVYAGILILFLYMRGRAFVNFPELSSERVLSGTSGSESANWTAEVFGVMKVFLVSYIYYFSKLVFPFTFNAFTEEPPGGLPRLITAITVLPVILLTASYSILKRENVSGFSLLWILVTLFPSALVSLTDIGSASVAERYLYIPSAGFCLLLGYSIFRLGNYTGKEYLSLALALILGSFYLLFTVHRQGVWKDGITLWEDTAKKSSLSSIPHINYGIALLDAGREDEALKELQRNFGKGVKINDRGRSVTANNIGVVYINKRDIHNAEKWFLKAYEYDPGYYKTSYHLGLVNYLKGKAGGSREDYLASEAHIKKALQVRPFYGKAYLLLAMVYVELGDGEKARENAGLALESGLTDALAEKAARIMRARD